MLRLLKIVILIVVPVLLAAQHPVTFFTRAEAAQVRANLFKYPVLTQSYSEIKNEVDQWIGKDVDVPFPKDAAGGYTHDKHKANYTLMFNAGILYNLTGDAKYAKLVKDMFMKYAALNPTLKNHPQATSSSPGRIFWQALNDANWLVYTGMAYDLIYNSLTVTERKTIEDGAFKPEVDFVTKDLQTWFDLIHNHGVWACAGVGIVGIATNNKEYVDMALYGTKKDGKSGFLAQLEGLFAPDGYYTEGPYYVRYAILPYYLFANALHRAKPGLKIFEHRNRILQKALLAGLQQTNLNGSFFPVNDALKEKDYTSNELVTAINIAFDVYGKDDGLLVVAKKQGRVMLHKGGAAVAAALVNNKTISAFYPYKTIEFTDGVKGNEGGISLLRNGKGADLSTLIFKYTSHGLSHGHYDKLNINFFDRGNEILTDYGSVRFIGVEQKFGGRYLPENKTFASQTIAHNTIVVDEKSHFDGKENVAEKFHPQKIFSSTTNEAVQVVMAADSNAYKGVRMQRAVYLLQLPGGKKLVADVFHVASKEDHQYDLPFHYNGHLISTSAKYKAYTNSQEALGNNNGYQYLWKEAEASVNDTTASVTFLNDRTYYTVSSMITGQAKLFFTRLGANDPNFNLRHEPSFIIRKNGKDQTFVNVVEVHGKFDPIAEFSTEAYSTVKDIRLLHNDDQYTIAQMKVNGKMLVIAQCNKQFDAKQSHTASGINWVGPFTVLYDGKKL